MIDPLFGVKIGAAVLLLFLTIFMMRVFVNMGWWSISAAWQLFVVRLGALRYFRSPQQKILYFTQTVSQALAVLLVPPFLVYNGWRYFTIIQGWNIIAASYPSGLAGLAAYTGLIALFFPANELRDRYPAHLRVGTGKRKSAPLKSDEDDLRIPFGGRMLPPALAKVGFLFLGSIGAGKTILISHLQQYVLKWIGRGKGHRAVIFDYKTESIPFLAALKLRCPILTLNPFDYRSNLTTEDKDSAFKPGDIYSAGWAMGKDCHDRTDALQVAAILFPDENEKQKFYPLSAQVLTANIIIVLMTIAGMEWEFRDLLYALRNEQRMQQLLAMTEETAECLEFCDPSNETYQNIRMTIKAFTARYEPIAAMWSHAKRKISLSEWIEGEFILIIGYDPSASAAMQTVNRLIFRQLAQRLLSEPNSETRRSWVFLDELANLGKLDQLDELALTGRSRGVCVVAGVQNEPSMRSLYTPDVAHKLMAELLNRAYLPIADAETALWASRQIGSVEIERPSTNEGTSESESGPSRSSSVSWQKTDRALVMPIDLQTLTRPDSPDAVGVCSYFRAPSEREPVYLTEQTWEELNLVRPDPSVPAIVRRSRELQREHQKLTAWNAQDLKRLGLPLVVEVSNKEEEEEKSTPTTTATGKRKFKGVQGGRSV